MKALLVNGRFLTQTVTGVQRYCIELMHHLDLLLGQQEISTKLKIVCLKPPGQISPPGWKNIELRQVGINRGNLWEQLDLPAHLKQNLLFSPANVGPWGYRNQIVMFHDASVFAVPDVYSIAFRAKYIFIFRQLARRARSILTNSRFSQTELARYLHAPRERFKVIPLGADHLIHIQPDKNILQKNQLAEHSYLLLVASLSPHKNIQRTVEAIKLVNREVKIVIAGTSPNPRVFHEIPTVTPHPKIQMLENLKDPELKALYENALALIIPSTYEGFGLPVLEAMYCGCPVLCSNTASLPEIAGDAALYFNPLDTQNLAETINTFLLSPALQADLRSRGHQHSARYSWMLTAQRTLEVFLTAFND